MFINGSAKSFLVIASANGSSVPRANRRRDLQTAGVRRFDFGGRLPIRRAQARGGFKNEATGRERPGNSSGAVAEQYANLRSSNYAGV